MTLTVLVVDDATFVRDMIKRTVRQLVPGVQLIEAQDGVRATALIRSKKPDLILSDWEMPQMSGEELLHWVREQPESTDTPFVMITSRGDRNHVITAVNAGVNDYLSKPFTSDELTRKITKQLKRLGYQAPTRGTPSNQAVASSSLDALTGGNPKAANTTTKSSTPDASATNKQAHGKVFLRFPKMTCDCQIRDLTLQALNGTIARPDTLPTVFDQVSVDFMDENDNALARINAYIHAISAAEPHPNTTTIKVIVRFVDQDPEKLEILSNLIT